jgi:Site-specific recombinase XerD
MAQIRKRATDVYQISIYVGRDEEGKRKVQYETFYGCKADAKVRADELEIELRRKVATKYRMMDVAKLLELWLDDIKDTIYERTYEKYVWHVKRLKPMVGDLQLYELTPIVLKERLKGMQELSERTIKDIYCTLRTALNAAHTWDLVRSDLMRGVKAPKVVRKDRPVFSPNELTIFLKTAQEYKHYLVLRILVLTGMRIGEALGLEWRDIDFQQGLVTIIRAADTKHRKLKDTKTKNSKRVIELDEETMLELSNMRKRLGAKVNANDLVFQNGDSRPLRYNAVRRTKERVLVKSGLHHIRLHDLRHSVASILIDQGQPMTVVASALGQTPSTTANTYSHALRRGKSIASILEG